MLGLAPPGPTTIEDVDFERGLDYYRAIGVRNEPTAHRAVRPKTFAEHGGNTIDPHLPTVHPPAARPRGAGAPVRFLAIVADLAVLSALFFPTTRLVKGTWIMSTADHAWVRGWLVTDPLCIAFLVVMFLYFVLFEAFMGATPGKWVLSLRVVGAGGSPPGLRKALVRNVLRLVDGLPAVGILAAVLIATSSDRTRLGDRIAGTRVIHVRPD